MDLAVLTDLLLSAGGRPHEASGKILTWLLDYIQGRTAALWHAKSAERFVLETSVSLDQESIQVANELWVANKEELLAGRPIQLRGCALVPIAPDRSFLFVDGLSSRPDLETIKTIGAAAAKALRRSKLPQSRPGLSRRAAARS